MWLHASYWAWRHMCQFPLMKMSRTIWFAHLRTNQRRAKICLLVIKSRPSARSGLSSPGLVTLLILTPIRHMNTCANFFGWKWGKVWTSHLRTNQGRVLICWSSKRYNWACPRDEAVFQTSFPASSLFFFLQKSKSTKRYRGPRLNEWLHQDLLIKLLLGLSMCWRWGRFFQLLSSPQPCSAAIFKIVTR